MGSSVTVAETLARLVAGKYEPLCLIGAGGMGEVYMAEHRYTRRKVAIKLVHPGQARHAPTAEARFFQEAQIASAVRHPAIVDVLDAGKEPDGTLYLVFELLEGQDMEAALANAAFRPTDLVRIGVRVLDALAATHASGLLHRDIKPANIFLARGSNGATTVKLLDFGIAKKLDASGTASGDRGTVVGTVEYMSPEQAAGLDLDARADVWSTAAVLFRGLAGRPPFCNSSFHRMVLSVATEDAPSLKIFRPDLPEDLIGVIDRGLMRDREQRWASAEDMAQALALCDHRSLEAAACLDQLPETGDLFVPDTYVRDTAGNPAPARRATTLIVRDRVQPRVEL